MEFFLLGHIYGVIQILSDYRFIGGNLNNVHAVNVTELLLLCQGRTCHTGLLCIFVKEILEGDRRERLALPLYLHMLLSLDGLVQSVGIPSSRHDTSRKLIYDQHLVFLHHIVLIPVHQAVGTKGQVHIMLDLQVLRVSQVLNLEELLYLFDTVGRQVYHLILLVDHVVAGLGNLLTHNGGHLRHFTAGLAPLQLPCQNIADLVKLRGLSALSGNDQRRTGLIDQYGVHLVDNRVMQISLHKLFLVDHHVVTQVIEAQLIICHIRNITVILLPALVVIHVV